MTFGAQALSINVTALERNLPNIADNPAIKGQTDSTYNGFGLKANSANPNDVAYFFAEYAKDNTNATGINIVLNSENASSGGYKLAEDIVAWAGDNGYLEEEELQAWADKIGFKGNIRDVMITMSEMDQWLYGDGTLELVPESDVPVATEPEETDDTAPTDCPEAPVGGEERRHTGLFGGIVEGAISGLQTIYNGLKPIGQGLANIWNGALDLFKID